MNYDKLKNLEQTALQTLIDDKQLILSRHCDNCKHRIKRCSFLDETYFKKSELKEIAQECELYEEEI